MTLAQMKNQLGMENVPEIFETLYEQIKDTWQDRAALILSDEFITDVIEKSGQMTAYLEPILAGAKGVRENPALCLLVCILEGYMGLDTKPDNSYIAPEGEGVTYDMLHLFPTMPAILKAAENFRKRNVPADVIANTMKIYTEVFDMTTHVYGRPFHSRQQMLWKWGAIHNRFIRIDRFNYDTPSHFLKNCNVYRSVDGEVVVLANKVQVHTSGHIVGAAGCKEEEGSFYAEVVETDTYIEGYPSTNGLIAKEKVRLPKPRWALSLTPEDLVPRIHIPAEGAFDDETVGAAFERAKKIFKECFPDTPCKAFFCESWLMSEQLKDFLKPDSKILGFQKWFIKTPLRSGGADVFDFAFRGHTIDREHPETWPEDTTLQRGVKKLYMNGEFLHEGTGIFYV